MKLIVNYSMKHFKLKNKRGRLYSRIEEQNGEFNCLTINFKTESRINNLDDVYDFIAESQEEINTKDDYIFNGIFIVGSDLIDYIKRKENDSRNKF